MFHMGIPGRRKNHGINRGIIKRLRPSRKSFVLTLFALMFATLLSLGSGETKGVSAAPNGQYPVDHVIFNSKALELYTTGQWAPYVHPQDSFMLVQNNERGFANQDSVNNLNSWARRLKNKHPRVALYAATSGLRNMRFIAPKLDKGLFEGIMYVYEPGRINEPEFTWTRPGSDRNMREAAQIAKDAGLQPWGKPSGRWAKGRPFFGDSDYGIWANIMAGGGQNIQTQGSCRDQNNDGSYVNGPADFKAAIESIISQYRAAGATSHLFVQVTTTSHDINSSPPDEAFACALLGWKYPEVERVTLWSSPGGESADMAERFLKLREKLLDNPPPPPAPAPTDPLPIPGRIEAEDYQAGGAGVAYHDTTSGNSGGAYRSDDVDIQPTSDQGGGYNIGWTDPGEWLAFEVEIAQAGYYDITARVASAVAGEKSLHLEVDGVAVTGPMSFSDASGWQSWQDVRVPQVNLPAGRHELRLVIDSDSFNVNYLDLTPSPAAPPSVVLPLPGRIEAEAYKAGGAGVGYHDSTPGNSGGQFRADDVDIEVTTDAGGGYNVGWTDPGEWLAFEVEVAQTGRYDLIARMASAVEGMKTLHVEVDGVDVTGPLSFSDASGWQSWLDAIATGVPLTAGRHELRIVVDADPLNVNYVDVLPSDNQPPTVSILSPENETSFLATETITFSGSAADVEDGDLTQSLVWTSSLDGQVGTGGATQAALSTGEHVITLMATDNQGASGSEAVNITVVDLVSGDANQDGQFTGDDVYLVVDWVIGRQPMPQAGTPAFMAADVDADGSITANDVALMIARLSEDPDQSSA